MVALHANFRMTGWRWPLRPGDTVELWRDNQMVGEIAAELLTSIILHYLVSHELTRRFDDAMIPAATALDRRPLVKLPARAVHDRDYRAELRARRRARRPVT